MIPERTKNFRWRISQCDVTISVWRHCLSMTSLSQYDVTVSVWRHCLSVTSLWRHCLLSAACTSIDVIMLARREVYVEEKSKKTDFFWSVNERNFYFITSIYTWLSNKWTLLFPIYFRFLAKSYLNVQLKSSTSRRVTSPILCAVIFKLFIN